MPEYYIGVDLGQAADYTALSVADAEGDVIKIRHLERLPLGIPYPDQVTRIKQLYCPCSMADPNTRLIVDHTGVGRAVIDLIRREDLYPVALTITGGNQATRDGYEWSVPKRDLVSALIVAFQTGRLKISRSLSEAETLTRELMNFNLKVNLQTGHDSYEAWREGIHDDLVLSVAMAVYAATIDPRYDSIDIEDCMGDPVNIPTLSGSPVKFEWYNEI
ncbi:hypothetical protein KHC33_00360 [Methanospirillum sp. J.3.6.1-F.2.7.3]|uniref:Terminase large subunit gp17-like C-terminal domain-containing protein n=1 Tax=Methanospirillum purgamenti TaxID=2834276 RepID=A0A8E7AX81_9EURY|nr:MULTISPECIES: hypothetical protein [Methanospirillum]MDX8549648.1 hypothetical protein [Methanospirillum hungatei]QVV89030.1 hypothetical protein KHC33_00360 [Methanospirillum sp. J.3.6.1-F.2.7.3]